MEFSRYNFIHTVFLFVLRKKIWRMEYHFEFNILDILCVYMFYHTNNKTSLTIEKNCFSQCKRKKIINTKVWKWHKNTFDIYIDILQREITLFFYSDTEENFAFSYNWHILFCEYYMENVSARKSYLSKIKTWLYWIFLGKLVKNLYKNCLCIALEYLHTSL